MDVLQTSCYANVNVYSGCVTVGRLHFLIDCLVNPPLPHPLTLPPFPSSSPVPTLLPTSGPTCLSPPPSPFLLPPSSLPSIPMGPCGADNDTALIRKGGGNDVDGGNTEQTETWGTVT